MKLGLWYVVIVCRDGRQFWAWPHSLTPKAEALQLRDELRRCRESYAARLRFFGYVDTKLPVKVTP